MVRGMSIAHPLSIRILLEERDASRPLNLRGELLSLNGDKGRDSELNCKFKDPSWICSTKSIKKIKLPLSVSSDEGFVHMGKSFYRSKIELIPKGKKVLIINELDLESYLVGIVNSEISSKYPREAIKAQVVAARSYALACAADRRKRGSLYDLDSTEMDQVYKGAQVEDAMSHFAVRETRGEVLTWNNHVLKAYYHSSSGGSMELPEEVWGGGSTVLKKYDHGAFALGMSPPESLDGDFYWKIVFGSALGLKINGLGFLRDIQIIERTPSERVRKVLLIGDMATKILTGPQLRKLFGGRWLKSTLFFIIKKGSRWVIEGRGFGHGVGLSQLGARNLAKKGWNYKKILNSYYPSSKLKRLALVD